MKAVAIAYGRSASGEKFYRFWTETGIVDMPDWAICANIINDKFSAKNVGFVSSKRFSIGARRLDFLYGSNYPEVDIPCNKTMNDYMLTCIGYCANCISNIYVLCNVDGVVIPVSDTELIELDKYKLITNASVHKDGVLKLRQGKLDAVPVALEQYLMNIDYRVVQNILNKSFDCKRRYSFIKATGKPNFGKLDSQYDEYQELLRKTGRVRW